MGYPGMSCYTASKFALEGWSEALRFELKVQGIQVVLVEPDAFKTDIRTRNAKFSACSQNPTPANATRVARCAKFIVDRKWKFPDPQVVADTIAEVLDSPRPILRYLVGTYAKKVLLMRQVLPWSLYERLTMKDSGMDK